jgi:hypothetical protein
MNQQLLIFFVIVILVHLTLNLALSKEIVDWIPSVKEKIFLILSVWCIPIVGAIFTYRHLKLGWFQPSTEGQNESASISSAILGVEAVFNPGIKHVIDVLQEEHIEIKEEGESYKRTYQEWLEKRH